MEFIIIVAVILITIYIINQSGKITSNKTKEDQYYEDIKKGDPEFYEELDIIYNLIANQNCQDLKLISKEAKVSLTECIVKIRYLIKIGKLPDEYHIDHINAFIVKCTKKDEKLLKKYSHYILGKKYQIEQIAKVFQGNNTNGRTYEELVDETYEDIKHLVDKGILKNIKIDEENQKIIYLKKKNDYISKRCPNCGAINEVRRSEEGICKYCGTVVK